jgi:hypothetical protein
MNTTVGRAIAAVGVVLGFIAIWIDARPQVSYWSDGTRGVFLLLLACLAALTLGAGFAGRAADTPLFATGAVMLGFYALIPAALAFDEWDLPEAGTWLGVCAGGLIVIGAGISSLVSGAVEETPSGVSAPSLVAAAGVALVFPGIFLDLTSDGDSYWSFPGSRHSLGILLLIVAIACALAWAASIVGIRTRGLDLALCLVLLGCVSYFPVSSAFDGFGTIEVGGWLALAGAVLAAGGTWVARGVELPNGAT